MANFAIAKNFTKDLEGGFWNDPSVGFTYAGITKKNYPAWPGWRRILQLQKEKFNGAAIPRYTIFKDAELNKMVDEFYFVNHWGKYMKGNSISNQDISNLIYDFIVHKQYDAIAVINATVQKIDNSAFVDPYKLTESAIATINAYPRSFYIDLYNNRIKYYQTKKGFSQAMRSKFVERVKRFPAVLKLS